MRTQPVAGAATPAAAGMLADWQAAPARLMVTVRARRAVAWIRRRNGPQALLLSWPGGATCLPVTVFEPDAYDVIIGHVAGCPIHADVRQLSYYRDRTAVLDTASPAPSAASVLLLRRRADPALR